MSKYTVLRTARGLEQAFRPVVLTGIDQDYHIFIVRYSGDYVTHAHDKDEFVYILEGSLVFELGRNEMRTEERVRQGEAILIPAGTPHRPRCDNTALAMVMEKRGLQKQMNPSV